MKKILFLSVVSLFLSVGTYAESISLKSAYGNYCNSLSKNRHKKQCLRVWDEAPRPAGIMITLNAEMNSYGECPMSETGTRVDLVDSEGEKLLTLYAESFNAVHTEYLDLRGEYDLKTLKLIIYKGSCSGYSLKYKIEK